MQNVIAKFAMIRNVSLSQMVLLVQDIRIVMRNQPAFIMKKNQGQYARNYLQKETSVIIQMNVHLTQYVLEIRKMKEHV